MATNLNYGALHLKNVNIQGGGFVSGIIYSPAQQDLVYARTDMAGFTAGTLLPGPELRSTTTARGTTRISWASAALPYPSDANRVYLATGTYTQTYANFGVILASNDKGTACRTAATSLYSTPENTLAL